MEREKGGERPAGEAPLDGKKMGEDELLALWRKAQRVAWRLCRRTILRLRGGQGGFYEEGDFWQDLFLEFWRIARCWRARQAQEAELWAAWRRALSREGKTVLRRAPQRLWHAVEEPLDPDWLACWESPATAPSLAAPSLAAPVAELAPARALIQPEDGEATHLGQDALDRLERALWSLPLARRQLLYMAAVADLPAAQVARCLGLADDNLVYQRLHATRALLRRRWRERG